MEIWREKNDCATIPDTICDESGILGEQWPSFDGNGDVVLYTLDDQEHEWPRQASLGISATDVIWEFFESKTKNGSIDIEVAEFDYDNETRSYILYTPSSNPNPDGFPLVIGLHCHAGTAQGLLSYTSWIQKAHEENFIGVFPNGLRHPIGTAWNAGSSFEWMTGGTDDVGFISALIDSLIQKYDVDTTRIYATGHSNGSMMSYRLAAELSHRIAAIGCVAAPMVYEYCDPEYPVPIIHFHGLSDTTCPYEGKVKDFITIPHMDSTLAIWQEVNDCSSVPDTIHDESGIMGKKWPSSGGQGDIVLYTVETCEHGWPDDESYGISATDEIWDFFLLQSRSGMTKVKEGDGHTVPKLFTLDQNYPNPFNPQTTFRYVVHESIHVTLRIFNLAGQEIDTLVDGLRSAGEYEISWHPKGLPSGMYFFRIEAGEYTETKKLIINR
jgi:polyhydroxybutyrate depolymerase